MNTPNTASFDTEVRLRIYDHLKNFLLIQSRTKDLLVQAMESTAQRQHG